MEVTDLIKKADRYRTKWSPFGWRDEANREKAIDLYKKAYQQAILAKEFKLSATVALRVAELSELADSQHEAREYYVKGAQSYEKGGETDEAIKVYRMVVAHCERDGNLSTSAKYWAELGDLLQQNPQTTATALESYGKAINAYEAENQWMSAIKIRERVLGVHFEANDYVKAREVLDEIIRICRDREVFKHSLNDHLYGRSLIDFYLCATTDDEATLAGLLETALDTSPSFENTREYGLLKKCVDAFLAHDKEAYQGAFATFDRVTRVLPKYVRLYHEILRAFDVVETDPVAGNGGVNLDDLT